MAYRVEFRPRAEQDLEALFRHLVQEAPLLGRRWVSAPEDAIYTLRELPERCPVVRQLSRPKAAVRQLLHGRYPHVYKVYFVIEPDSVWILHIRHGARRR
jgi:plasmid stabilization system protein ParE